MSRELKFRAFNTTTKELISDVGLLPNKLDYAVSIGSDGIYINPSIQGERILMQFTGLKDKNGVEIFERDVMSFLGENWQVVFFEQYAGFMLQKGNDLANITTQEEVIGNIYQNPELIKNQTTIEKWKQQ